MSGLYLLLLFGIWVLVGWVIYKLWRVIKNRIPGLPIASIGIGIVLFSLWFGWPFWEMFGKKMYWDAKVRELCAIDGGVKVYEKVELPAERFDKWGNVHIPEKKKAKPDDEYHYESETTFLRNDNPKIVRMHTRIIRRRDGNILGESVYYGRGGGDILGPWHPSGFTCPEPTVKPYLETSIFKKGEL